MQLTRLTEADVAEAVGVMARSFAGDEKVDGELTFSWAMGEGIPLEAKLKAFGWYLKWSFLISSQYGVCIGAREGGADGKLLGVCCVLPARELRRAKADRPLTRGHVLKTAMKMGGPPPSEPPGFAARMEEVSKMLQSMRDECAAGCYYVSVLAVDVGAQGRGCSKALLRAVHALADGDGDGCGVFLETHGPRNVTVYNKCGYDEVLQKEHRAADSTTELVLSGMKRGRAQSR